MGEKPPKRNSPKSRDLGEDLKQLSLEDSEILAAFCADVELTEISFGSWQKLHHDLDLKLRVKISADEARSGGSREVEFVRSVSELSQAGLKRRRTKERLIRVVRWPANLKSEYVIVLTGDGDCNGNTCGNVLVTLYFL